VPVPTSFESEANISTLTADSVARCLQYLYHTIQDQGTFRTLAKHRGTFAVKFWLINTQSVPSSIDIANTLNSPYTLLNLHTMTAAIEACKNLIDKTLPAEFPTNSTNFEVNANPQRIVQNFYVALYGQSTAGTKIVNMRSPTL